MLSWTYIFGLGDSVFDGSIGFIVSMLGIFLLKSNPNDATAENTMTPLLFSILACSEQELINQKDWNSEFIPVISVQPNRIDFISNDNQTQSSSFSITNIGEGLLEIENIELDNNLDFFYLA